ncbi:uncharacterized protein LOC6576409 [Drosophila mojavensis]|uniref:Spermatogenesis-associated protein 17 n=1 Tax=Drosophila mojavensis TaxID=7230 RepID=B4KE96_DROMO|nr:uncharacterized protein LOC6576409 [Drosophila mojavensis]EDW11841.2 uncharacterized protein Dmoj_GI12944 [Drosophila mojavensis]
MTHFDHQKIRFAVLPDKKEKKGSDENLSSSCDSFHQKYSRTSLLIMDYKQFLAARAVQAAWRRHQQQEAFHYATKAAITIQRWWRGFHARNRFFSIVEQRVQDGAIAFYNRAATKIQAFFRGWYTRKTVHDMHNLRRMQICAAEDLLNDVACKLHHLLRTYSIPGIYSLRNSHCLSKVEQLMTSMTYRFLNDRASYHRVRRETLARNQATQFERNAHYTNVPYPGPNFNSACEPCREDIIINKPIELCMYKIITEYERATVNPTIAKTRRTLTTRKFHAQSRKMWEHVGKVQGDFCSDVINSMRKWHIWNAKKLIVARDIYRDPEKLSYFLDDVSRLLRQYTQSCYCHEITLPKI